MNPLVSIIIPVYNCEKYIFATIQSCVGQNYANIEIILVNDGSTDNSEEIILSFKDPRIHYYKIKNEGSCEARNFGISKASGRLYQFLDHDDLLDTDKISSQVGCYKNFGNDYIYSSNMGSVSGNITTLDKGYDLYYRNFKPEQYFDTVVNQFGKYITTGAWLVPSSVLKLTYGWNSKSGINDDGEYFMRLILCSKGVVFCKGAIFYFRRDAEGSLSKQFDTKEVYIKWLYSYKSYTKFFLMYFQEDKAKALSRKALSKYYCSSYPYYPELLKDCRLEINKLGYKTPTPYGGRFFILISHILGVDNALKIYSFKNSLKSKRFYNKCIII